MIFIFIFIILSLFLSLKFDKKKDIDLNREYTKCLKGFSAIYILFHHLIIARNSVGILEPIKYFAFPFVSYFLFISGYGLMKSLINEGNIINFKTFYKKRFLRVVLPYLLVIILYFIYYLLSNNNINIFNFVYSIIFAKNIGPLWYMTTIIVIYILFPIIFYFFKGKKGIYIFLILTIFYLIFGIITNYPANWLSSIIGFFIGIFYSYNENNLNKLLLKTNVIFVIGVFIILYIFRLFISYKICSLELIHLPFRNIICILFIISIVCFSSRISIKSKVLDFFGNISYEIYIIHPFLIYIFRNALLNSDFLCIIIFIISIVLSLLLNYIINYIYSLFKLSNLFN